MEQEVLRPKEKKHPMMAMILSTILITMFLFFIDEGYYNFRWMKEPGNWLAFAIYFTAIFLGQVLFFKILFRNYQGASKTSLSVICGSVLGIILLVVLFYALLGLGFTDGLT